MTELSGRDEQWYRTVLNSGNDAVFAHGLTEDGMPGTFLEVNDKACLLLGYSRQELLSMTPAHIDSPQSEKTVREIMKDFHEHRQVLFENTHIAKNGTEIPVEINARMVNIEGKEIVVSVARDISPRKQTEFELQLRTFELDKRVSELDALNTISEIIHAEDISIEKLFNDVVQIIPRVCQPDAGVSACIIWEGERFESKGFKTEQVLDTIDLKFDSDSAAYIEVHGSVADSTAGELMFLPKKQQKLLKTVAVQLENAVKRITYSQELQKYQKKLKKLVKERTRQLRQNNRELENSYTLQSVISALYCIEQNEQKLDEVLRQALASVLELSSSGLKKGALFLYDSPGKHLVLAASYRISPDNKTLCNNGCQAGTCFFEDFVHKKNIVFVAATDDEQGQHCGRIPGYGHYCIPIHRAGELLGLLLVYTKASAEYSERMAGNLKAIAETFANIIAHKRVEIEVQQRDEQFNQLVQNIPEIFWTRELDDGALLFVSKAYEEIWGRSCKSLYVNPTSWFQYIYPADKKKVLGSITIEREGKPTNIEYRIVRPDGQLRWVRSRSFPVFDDKHTLIRIAGIIADITHFKESAERDKVHQDQLLQADKMASLGVLVSGMGHEINNPNNFILPNSKIILKAWNDVDAILKQYYEKNGEFLLAGLPYSESYEEVKALINGVTIGAERIKEIVKALRDYAQPVQNNNHDRVNVNNVVASSVFLCGNLIKKSTQLFSTDLQDNLPPVYGNAQRLEQVVINLLTNACQALNTPKQSVTVKTMHNRESNKVILTVKDEGRGIPQDDLKRILDPFFTTKRTKGGTGLGLPISFNIIKSHKGDLMIRSNPGQGATVTCMLPAFTDGEKK